jgi:hypothetical protein
MSPRLSLPEPSKGNFNNLKGNKCLVALDRVPDVPGRGITEHELIHAAG